jgi:hypothetical protein
MRNGQWQLQDRKLRVITVQQESIRRFSVARGDRSRAAGGARGFVIGAGIGIATGAVLGALLPLAEQEFAATQEEKAAIYAITGGFFGGVIGIGVGVARPGPRWVQVPVASIRF